MFLFLKLLLAHLIADFILQFDELYQLKVKSYLGHLFHVLIHLSISLLLALPYLRDPKIFAAICALSTLHYFQDNLKYHFQARHEKSIFFCFTIDQIIHFLFLTAIFLFPLSKERLAFPFSPFNSFYQSDLTTWLLIIWILTTFGGAYLLHALRRSFVPQSREDHFITSLEMSQGIFERTGITEVFLFLGLWPAVGLAFIFGVPRLFSKKLRNLPDFALSFIYAACIGLLFRKIL